MDMLLNPYWMINYNTKNNEPKIDQEYTLLKIKAYEQKCLDDIKNEKYIHLIETIYHMMNLTNFVGDKNIYSPFFKQQTQFNNIIKKLHEDIEEYKENSILLSIANDVREIFVDLIKLYLNDIITKYKIDIILKNRHIHHLNSFHILFKNQNDELNLYHYNRNEKSIYTLECRNKGILKDKDDILKYKDVTELSLMGIDYKSNLDTVNILTYSIIALNLIFNKTTIFNGQILVSINEHIKENNALKFKFI